MITLGAVIISLIMITIIFMTSIVYRPAQVRIIDALNTTIYNMNLPSLTSWWVDLRDTVNYLWFIIPALGFIILMLYVWMTAQKKEYVTGGEYF